MKDIFEFVKTEENAYQTLPISVIDGWEWRMIDHIKKTIFYKNSLYTTGNNDSKPFKNIIRPILNLQYRAEGFDVKDILIYIDDVYQHFKSFLVKKFHDKWARENSLDTFIDEVVETYCDIGGVLAKDINKIRPEVVPWPRIAFCDQTDILSGPIAEKHNFSPEELKETSSLGWGETKNGATGSIDDLLVLAKDYYKDQSLTQEKKQSKTPGRYIEVYEVHGIFSNLWLQGKENYEDKGDEISRQLHIIAFYKDEKEEKQGFTLYKGKEKNHPYKLLLRDKIYGRALGFGGAEELFEPQVWTNYSMIRMKAMLDGASKVILQTADSKFRNRQITTDLDNNEILIHDDGKPLQQVDTIPRNIVLFEKAVESWQNQARSMGAATDSILGESPSAGTPFKLQELITAESHSLHEYRKGKIAIFIEEIYRDWILPKIAKEVVKEQKFMTELNLDEMQSVVDSIVINQTNQFIKEKILNGELPDQTAIEDYKQEIRNSFMKGNKKFISILEGEFKDMPLQIKINIAGKQKYMAGMVDKLTNVFRAIIANPAILQNPSMAKLFNQILEYSGMNPIDFSGFNIQQTQEPIKGSEMLKNLAKPRELAEAIA